MRLRSLDHDLLIPMAAEKTPTIPPSEAHRLIRASCPKAEDFDFFLYTDGAGYQDGFGGHAALLIRAHDGAMRTVVGGSNATTVARQEFEALLCGLQALIEMQGPAKDAQPKVSWTTDRESLALSVWRKSDGQPFYGRKACPDLWARFKWYEDRIDVTPFWVKRETHPLQDIPDRLSSEFRVVTKEWYGVQITDQRITPDTP